MKHPEISNGLDSKLCRFLKTRLKQDRGCRIPRKKVLLVTVGENVALIFFFHGILHSQSCLITPIFATRHHWVMSVQLWLLCTLSNLILFFIKHSIYRSLNLPSLLYHHCEARSAADPISSVIHLEAWDIPTKSRCGTRILSGILLCSDTYWAHSH